VPAGWGGRTVFPDYDFSQTPVQGTALFYRGKTELVHYSEAMVTRANHRSDTGSAPTKWILQLLLDFDQETFRTGECYVWDGEH
jgi:hypothetical protein